MTTQLFIDGLEEEATVQIINTEGKVMIKETITTSKASIDVSTLASGHYLCAITMKNVTKTIGAVKN